MNKSSIAGCILGTAVGDSIGLPYEGVSRKRAVKMLGAPDRHRFVFRRGMISDDTEHTCLVVQAMIASGTDLDAFTQDFASRLRWWFASLPAGIGRATLRSCFKLWCGISPERSGVFSAGNGPAMRAAVFGAALADISTIVQYVRKSSRVTHTDPKAEYGAIAVALAAFEGRQNYVPDAPGYIATLGEILGSPGDELVALLKTACDSVAAGESTLEFAASMGLERGVTGYTYHTVPVVIHAWLSNPRDYRASVTDVIQCGGDADTTAAIVGGIVGASTGEMGIPQEWIAGICDWPRSVTWMRKLAIQLESQSCPPACQRPVSTSFAATLLRNLAFLGIVLFHGFRRLFPPY